MNSSRVELRRAHDQMMAVQDAELPMTPEKYFLALCDTPEEGEARFNLHRNRVESALNWRGGNGTV